MEKHDGYLCTCQGDRVLELVSRYNLQIALIRRYPNLKAIDFGVKSSAAFSNFDDELLRRIMTACSHLERIVLPHSTIHDRGLSDLISLSHFKLTAIDLSSCYCISNRGKKSKPELKYSKEFLNWFHSARI